MNEPIHLPTLSDTMETGRLTQWLKNPGDVVKKGDILAEVETDKAVMDVEAFHDGYLAGPLADTDSDIPVGTIIGYISDTKQQASTPQSDTTEKSRIVAEPEAVTTTSKPPEAQSAPASMAQPQPVDTEISAEKSSRRPEDHERHGVIASPYARGLAHELNIDLANVEAAGDGVIHAPQVLAAAYAGPLPNLDVGPEYRYKLFTSKRRAVADNMIATLGTPIFRVSARLPLGPLMKLVHEQERSLTLLLAKACALCVQTYPLFNAVYTPRAIALREQVDIGIAVDVTGGLLTPVLRDAAKRSINELAEAWRVLRDKIERNRLSPNEYQGATFYLSNLGMFKNISHFDAIVPPGSAAILSLGAEHDGMAEFTLNCDHRVVYGADAARFLETLADYLSNPESMETETN